MRRYDIYKLDGDKLKYIKRFWNRNKVDEFMAHSTEDKTFYVMYYYVDYSDKSDNWTYLSSVLYLNGLPVRRSRKKIEVVDIEKYKLSLGRVYTTDGNMYFINNRQLTCQDVFNMIGGWGNVKVVKDEPERWAIISRDVAFILLGKSDEQLPRLNRKASAMFGETLYGDVIYINENYC